MRALRVLAATLCLAAAASCGGAGAPEPRAGAGARCDPDHLDACERAIAAAIASDADPKGACSAYAEARAKVDDADPWAKAWGEIRAPRPAALLIVLDATQPNEALQRGLARVSLLLDTVLGARSADRDRYRIVKTAALPAPRAIAADELLLAFGIATGADHVIHVRSSEVTEIFPRDPLAPFVPGLPPVLRATGVAEIADDTAIAAAARQAIALASELRYVDAAGVTDQLANLLAKKDPVAEPVVRGRYALQLLTGAGIALEADPPRDPPPVPAYGAPAASDTVYGDWLRVRTARDDRAEWAVRRGKILARVPADRRGAFEALFAPAGDCATAAKAPPMAGPRDLPFAAKLAASLATEGSAAGALEIGEWLPRYETMALAVDKTRSFWAYAPSVLYERGDGSGLSPSGTAVYRRVSEMARQHVAALSRLLHAFPARYRSLSHLPLVYSSGVLGDDKLREKVVELTQATVQDKLARATDAPAVFDGVLAGAFAGMSYPPAIQAAHYLALQAAFTAKLHGDLTKRTGWDVAGLYAADALFRILADQPKNLPFSSEHIARALGDPAIPHPALAALATSLGRYAALGLDGKLDPEQAKDRAGPERRAAREALKSALRGLGEEREASEGLLEDVTDLSDGLIAAVAFQLSASQKAGPEQCAKEGAGPSPAVRRAVAKLGDVRRRILLQPRMKQGEGAWIRRVRLIVTVMSDALDILGKTKKAPAFAVSSADAERWLAGGLREWDERSAAEALTAAYVLIRDFMTAKNAEQFVRASGGRIRKVVVGALGFVKGGSPLLEALASMPVPDGKQGSDDASALLLSYAKGFYEKKQNDQADLLLICALSIAALSHSAPPKEAIELAAAHRSRVEWALRFLAEIDGGRHGVAPEPGAYEAGMRKTTDDACAVAASSEVLAVMKAVRQFATGDRRAARAELDGVLDRAETKGLPIPKMTYRYEEKTATKVFALSLDVSYGGGFLEGSNSLQVGLGIKSPGDPGGAMTATLAPTSSRQGGEEAARYYVHVAALAAAYHYLERDREHGSADAARAVGALVGGVRLGTRSVNSARPIDWGADSRSLLALDAQLAADAGQPFLAGDLWTTLRGTLAADATDATIAEILDPLPVGLASVKDLGPTVDRAKRSLRLAARGLPCVQAKVQVGGLEEVGCDAYPLAISLRVADALKKLPRLARAEASKCEDARALDAFLGSLEKKTYDPDLFTRALAGFQAGGKAYDAAVLLTRHRDQAHCNAGILSAARSLGRSMQAGSGMGADLLSVAVNCSASSIDPPLVDDLVALDDATRRLADPTRNFKVLLFVTDLAVRAKRWDVLARLTAQPEFVDRWLRVNPTAATAALLVDHAAAILSDKPVAAERTRSAFTLLCETFPPGDRASMCTELATLRATVGKPADKAATARAALESLVASATAPPAPPKKP